MNVLLESVEQFTKRELQVLPITLTYTAVSARNDCHVAKL